ncbi:MAG: nifK 2 [Firmicutes bacterium]|nr:nifK 2 [Bacillota bacterium]
MTEQIAGTLAVVDADLFAVITGCMTEIIGDDVSSVAKEFQTAKSSIIVAETGGFKGNSYKGYDIIMSALITQYVEKGLPTIPKQINLLGLVPALDVFWRGNLLELKRIFSELGIQVNAFVTPFDDLDSIKKSSQSVLNIVLSDIYGTEAANVFEEVHGIPYVNIPLPIGPTATKEFLLEVARHIEIDQEKLKQVLQAEKTRYFGFLQNVAEIYNDMDLQRFAVIIGDANYSYALTKFLADDFGWIPYFVAITDTLDEIEQAKLRQRFTDIKQELRPTLIFETDTSEIAAKLQKQLTEESGDYGLAVSPLFVLGSTYDRDLAADLKAGFLSVSYPITNRVITDQGYSGYRGGLHLANDILTAIIGSR